MKILSFYERYLWAGTVFPSMNRRKSIALISGIFSTFLSGCVGVIEMTPWGSSNSEVSDGIEYESEYFKGESVINNGLWDRRMDPDTDNQYHTVVDSEETAVKRFVRDSAASEFVEGINFDESYLLIVEYGMQSDKDLKLKKIDRKENEYLVDFGIESPRSIGDDWIVHSYLLELTDTHSTRQREFLIRIDGETYSNE